MLTILIVPSSVFASISVRGLPSLSTISTVPLRGPGSSLMSSGFNFSEPFGEGCGSAMSRGCGGIGFGVDVDPGAAHPFLRIDDPAGQLRPPNPSNGGMMSPHPSSGKTPPLWDPCP